MYESVKRSSKFDRPQFWQGRAVLSQTLVHKNSLLILVTNKKHSALSFTFFKKPLQKKRKFLKIFKGLLLLAGLSQECEFWPVLRTKVKFLKNVV